MSFTTFMQNKPNLPKSQMNVSIYLQTDYENKHDWTIGKNKPNQSQSKPISERPKSLAKNLATPEPDCSGSLFDIVTKYRYNLLFKYQRLYSEA